MSKVTIAELYRTYCDAEKWQTLKDIEIVPRKMVEMIIEKCADHASGPKPSDYIIGVSSEARWIKEYAESLLEQFEENSK